MIYLDLSRHSGSGAGWAQADLGGNQLTLSVQSIYVFQTTAEQFT